MKDEATLRQHFACHTCGGVIAVAYGIQPECCGALMREGKIAFPEGDPDQLRLHLLNLYRKPEVEWSIPEPDPVLELWQLKPGRRDGEKIGWIGVGFTKVEWVMVPGVTIKSGFANTVADAAQMMLVALQGGVGAAAEIREIEVVS